MGGTPNSSLWLEPRGASRERGESMRGGGTPGGPPPPPFVSSTQLCNTITMIMDYFITYSGKESARSTIGHLN